LAPGSGLLEADQAKGASVSNEEQQLQIPLGYPTSLVYVDESGSAANGRVFVVGALKVRRHGELGRAVRDVRDRTGHRGEFRFNRINRSTAHQFRELLNTIPGADVCFAATIVDRDIYDPTIGLPAHVAHAEVVSRLLRACINKRELVSVSMDAISTPRGVAIEDDIARAVNRRLRNKSIIAAAQLDSKTCDLLQLVDVLTSAVACDYRLRVGDQSKVSAHKLAVVRQAKLVLGVTDFVGRTGKVNVAIYQGRPKAGAKGAGSVVPLDRRRVG
jgi:hypothetical protein